MGFRLDIPTELGDGRGRFTDDGRTRGRRSSARSRLGTRSDERFVDWVETWAL
jgi:hypothetical protein